VTTHCAAFHGTSTNPANSSNFLNHLFYYQL
jgi:hypothetical protein